MIIMIMMMMIMTTFRSKTCIMASYRPAVREAPLCQLDWELHFTGEGVVTEVPQLLDKIFRGGVEENIRPEVRDYYVEGSQSLFSTTQHVGCWDVAMSCSRCGNTCLDTISGSIQPRSG